MIFKVPSNPYHSKKKKKRKKKEKLSSPRGCVPAGSENSTVVRQKALGACFLGGGSGYRLMYN